MNKIDSHAYLIMAHNEPEALRLLLTVIDDPRNNVYIHIDQRATSLYPNEILKWCHHAKIYFIERQKIYWGGHTMVNVMVSLLKCAVKHHNIYYHLLSGVDLPLQSQNHLHDFFKADPKWEYISTGKVTTWKISSRYKYYYPEKITEIVSRDSYRVLRVFFAALQALFFIDRTRRKKLEYHMGSQWFSITHNFANYVLEQEKFIERNFNYGFCVDEVFLPTLVMNSPFKKNVSPLMNIRYIDWDRGKPYTWELEDFKELTTKMNVKFARKFSYKNHPELMDKMKSYLLG